MVCMCGRFAVTTDPALLAEKIKAIDEATAASGDKSGGPNYNGPNYNAPNYNGARPTTARPGAKRHPAPAGESPRRVRRVRGGPTPPWAKATADGGPDTKGPLMINARSE